MATRWRSPPESSSGRWSSRDPSCTRFSSSRARSSIFLPRPAAQVQRQADVLEARQGRQQVEELEDESDLVAPDPGQVVVDNPATRLAVDADLAGGRVIEAADQIEQRRLAGSGRTDDRHHLASIDTKVDIVERSDAPLAIKALSDPTKFYYRIHNLRRVESTRMRQSWFARTTHSFGP